MMAILKAVLRQFWKIILMNRSHRASSKYVVLIALQIFEAFRWNPTPYAWVSFICLYMIPINKVIEHFMIIKKYFPKCTELSYPHYSVLPLLCYVSSICYIYSIHRSISHPNYTQSLRARKTCVNFWIPRD